MKIAIAKGESKFEKYLGWLEYHKINYVILDYENHETDIHKLEECSGIIFTGGVDVYPELYCDWDTTETKGTHNPVRDGFELKLIEIALREKMPVLSICRGMQLFNVYCRGSLIFDLEQIRNVNHKKLTPTQDRYHHVRIIKGTLLNEILGAEEGEINSSHHQALDRIGEGLIVNARSDDGVVEGIEFADKDDKSFFLGIQWHPERFEDFSNPFSKKIIDRFIHECNIFNKVRNGFAHAENNVKSKS